MADTAWAAGIPFAGATPVAAPRHSALVRVTHWITALCFLGLFVSGIEIVISHPRFYWGEEGNSLTKPLFVLPIPASRDTVPTAYNFVLPDQNGWSRSLHFQAAWLLVLTGLLYVLFGLFTRHFRAHLLPARGELGWKPLSDAIRAHLRFERPGADTARSYNVLQRLSYLSVVFVAFPLMVWTGLAMSPGFTSSFPSTVTILGGHQSARTIHFFAMWYLVLFSVAHVVMVWRAGFRQRVGLMITGGGAEGKEQ